MWTYTEHPEHHCNPSVILSNLILQIEAKMKNSVLYKVQYVLACMQSDFFFFITDVYGFANSFSTSVRGLTTACFLPVCMAFLPVFYQCAWPACCLFSTSVHGLTAACGLRLCQGCNNTCRASLLLSGIHCIAAHNRTARKILLKNLLNF